MDRKSSFFYLCNRIFKICVIIESVFFLRTLLSAKDLRISGSNHAEYWVFVDKNLAGLNFKEHLEDKLKLSINYSDLTLKGIFFFWNPSLPIPEKLNYFDYTAIYEKEPVNILYGRYYTTFGRGLVLNQYLDEDFRTDNSLYGLKTDFKYFNSQFTLLSGKPRNIFFEQNKYTIKNDTTDQLRGVNLETGLIPMTTLAGRYVRINRLVDLTPKAFTELFGGDIGVNFGPFESYFEYARQWGCHPVVGGRLKGEGILFTTGLAISGLGISFQYMDYDTIGFGGAGYRYNEPPTPIKSEISVNRGTDEKGFGISLSTTPVDILTGEFDYNKIKTHNNEDGVTEGIIKFTTHPNYNLEIIGGMEYLVKEGIELEVDRKSETKPNIELTYNFGSFYIETGYEHNFIWEDRRQYYEHAISLAFGKSEIFAFTFRYQRRSRVIEHLGDETNWPLAELSLDLTNRHNLRIRVGGEKGGLVCSGGVCRFEEPFKGVKAVLTSIF